MTLEELENWFKEKISQVIPGIETLEKYSIFQEYFSNLNSFLESKQEEIAFFYQEFENKKLKVEKGRAIMLLMEMIKKLK